MAAGFISHRIGLLLPTLADADQSAEASRLIAVLFAVSFGCLMSENSQQSGKKLDFLACIVDLCSLID